MELKKPILKKVEGALTPDSIMNMLFHLHSEAHYYHLQTTSFAQHKMLDELYHELQDSKDTICEYLLGKQAPKRFGNLAPHTIPPFSPMAVDMHLDEGCMFSEQLCDYAEAQDDEQLCNLASELYGLFRKSKYLNTLK